MLGAAPLPALCITGIDGDRSMLPAGDQKAPKGHWSESWLLRQSPMPLIPVPILVARRAGGSVPHPCCHVSRDEVPDLHALLGPESLLSALPQSCIAGDWGRLCATLLPPVSGPWEYQNLDAAQGKHHQVL